MVNARFCYLVSPDAKLASDIETGEPCEAYISFSMTDENEEPVKVPCDFYCRRHLAGIKDLAKLGGLKPEWLTPITIEEYIENVEGD